LGNDRGGAERTISVSQRAIVGRHGVWNSSKKLRVLG